MHIGLIQQYSLQQLCMAPEAPQRMSNCSSKTKKITDFLHRNIFNKSIRMN